jgi:hypothetical protein
MSPAWLLALALAGDSPGALPVPTTAPSGQAAGPEAPPPPAYPLGPLPGPDFLAPGDPFTLTDLRYSMSDSGDAVHAFAARVRYRSLGYLGVEFAGDRQGLSLQTHRLALAASAENGSWTLGAEWRGGRFVLSADAVSRRDDGGWALGPTVHFRLTPDLELYAWATGDTEKPEGRLLTAAGTGAFLQRGSWLEAQGEYSRSYEVTGAGSENRMDAGRLRVLAQVGRAEVGAEASLEDTEGRFPRREGDLAARLRLPLAPRLLLEGDGRGRFDHETGALRHDYGGALTWFGRRFTLPRAGDVARQSVALARRATERGEYELAAFDDDALRAQRERLSLSPYAADLRGDMEAVYRAQVEERRVPLLGVEVRHRDDSLTGESALAARALVGVPWPPAWPWQGDDASVPFLLLDLEHERVTTATSFRSTTDRASLTVSLNREIGLVVRLARREPNALDVVRGIGVRRTFAVACVYARGR